MRPRDSAAAIERPIARFIRVTGTLMAEEQADVAAETAGRIIATPINHAEYTGIRVTPNVYTTLEEIDTFGDAMEKVAGGS